MICLKGHDLIIADLQKALLEAHGRATAAEAEAKVLREMNARIDDEAKRGMNIITRGLGGVDFWNDPAREEARAEDAAKAEPVTPRASTRDWVAEGQRLEDAAYSEDVILRRQEILKRVNSGEVNAS